MQKNKQNKIPTNQMCMSFGMSVNLRKNQYTNIYIYIYILYIYLQGNPEYTSKNFSTTVIFQFIFIYSLLFYSYSNKIKYFLC